MLMFAGGTEAGAYVMEMHRHKSHFSLSTRARFLERLDGSDSTLFLFYL